MDTAAGLDQIFADLDADVAQHNPRCDLSGRCCRFTEYGHTLFLSAIEADRLLAPGLPAGATVDRHTCPYQIGGLCTARERRPLGCRVYFCDPAYAEKQVEISERYIGRLKRLHDDLDLPWSYAPLHHFLENKTLAKINENLPQAGGQENESA